MCGHEIDGAGTNVPGITIEADGTLTKELHRLGPDWEPTGLQSVLAANEPRYVEVPYQYGDERDGPADDDPWDHGNAGAGVGGNL